MPQFYVGDPVPWFHGRTGSSADFNFSLAGGRYIVLLFIPSTSDPAAGGVIASLIAHRESFDDDRLVFFGVTSDPADNDPERLADVRGVRWFLDFDHSIGRQFGVVDEAGKVTPQWYVIDPQLRVLATGEIDLFAEMMDKLHTLPDPDLHTGIGPYAPVLIIPRVFEPAFCQELIKLYETHGGEESGFMREVNGKTVAIQDPKHKRRADYLIDEEDIKTACRQRITRRILPEIKKAFQFKVTRMERYIVACYDAEHGGHFRAHRDNTTKGTAHRRFAVTLNLNADQYDGGELRFPEYGRRTYKPPTGGAVVFSCSLLHEATQVTRGKRYAFLPFLYDEEGAQVREANNQFLDRSLGQYKSGIPSPAEAATAES